MSKKSSLFWIFVISILPCFVIYFVQISNNNFNLTVILLPWIIVTSYYFIYDIIKRLRS